MLNEVNVFFVIVLSTTFCCVSNYRILGVFPIPTRSHFFLGSTLMKALAEAGHDVTIIAPFKDEQLPNLQSNGSYREIILEEVEAKVQKRAMKNGKLDKKLMGQLKGVTKFFNTWTPVYGAVDEDTLKDQRVTNLIQSNEKFDVVILTEFFNEMLKLLAYHFDASLVLFTNNALINWYYDDIGNFGLPSITPVLPQEMPFRMSFSQRLENCLEKIKMFMWFRSYNSQLNEIAKRYFPHVPSVEEMKKNVSLVLINSDISLEVARQTTPNMINIGGFHIRPPKKLPHDLQQIMDNASSGVIFFSLGSLIDSSMISVEKLEEVLQILGKRKETVLWKFSGELKIKPRNVFFRKWFPQQEILAHPNTKLFITHSGHLSSTEAAYYGVPTVSVPFFGDQPANAQARVEIGSGLLVSVENFGPTTIGNAIEEVISNQTYHQAAQRQSRIMRDRQNKPIDDAIFWVEYVARHKGAKHLRVPHLDMPLYQAYMLDILGLILVGLIVFTVLLIFLLIKIATYFETRRTKSIKGESTSKKKK